MPNTENEGPLTLLNISDAGELQAGTGVALALHNFARTRLMVPAINHHNQTAGPEKYVRCPPSTALYRDMRQQSGEAPGTTQSERPSTRERCPAEQFPKTQ